MADDPHRDADTDDGADCDTAALVQQLTSSTGFMSGLAQALIPALIEGLKSDPGLSRVLGDREVTPPDAQAPRELERSRSVRTTPTGGKGMTITSSAAGALETSKAAGNGNSNTAVLSTAAQEGNAAQGPAVSNSAGTLAGFPSGFGAPGGMPPFFQAFPYPWPPFHFPTSVPSAEAGPSPLSQVTPSAASTMSSDSESEINPFCQQ